MRFSPTNTHLYSLILGANGSSHGSHQCLLMLPFLLSIPHRFTMLGQLVYKAMTTYGSPAANDGGHSRAQSVMAGSTNVLEIQSGSQGHELPGESDQNPSRINSATYPWFERPLSALLRSGWVTGTYGYLTIPRYAKMCALSGQLLVEEQQCIQPIFKPALKSNVWTCQTLDFSIPEQIVGQPIPQQMQHLCVATELYKAGN